MSSKVIVTVELPEIPEGFQYTGEYRIATRGDYVRCPDGVVAQIDFPSTGTSHHIIRKVLPRAAFAEPYWHVQIYSDRARTVCFSEVGSKVDDCRHSSGNYFLSEKDAEQAADKISEVFRSNTGEK